MAPAPSRRVLASPASSSLMTLQDAPHTGGSVCHSESVGKSRQAKKPVRSACADQASTCAVQKHCDREQDSLEALRFVQPVGDLERLSVLRLGRQAELNHTLWSGLVRLWQGRYMTMQLTIGQAGNVLSCQGCSPCAV